MKDNRLRFSTLGYLASASRDSGRNKDYLVHSVQQIDIAHELDDNKLRAQAYLNLSRANEMLADYFKAVSYSRSAVQYSSTGDSIQGYALLIMADSYIGLCNFPKVLECLDKALSISHENVDHLMEVQVLSTMGKVFLALKDFPKALVFQRRAHELALSNATYAGEEFANISSKFVRLTKLKLATPLRLMGDFEGSTKCVEVNYIKTKSSFYMILNYFYNRMQCVQPLVLVIDLFKPNVLYLLVIFNVLEIIMRYIENHL
jgi:tetratricopeptide (TPR) repeat protein